MSLFQPSFPFDPAGDQSQAINLLCQGLTNNKQDQVLLGVTGSGKTYTMAQVIAQTERPTFIMAHNKTLAAQLYNEMKTFFPNDCVEYFVSYYDYYQPEAYIPRTGTYIEKESTINEEIDRMRHSATRSLLEKKNVIVVSSVSCIYGIGSAETYSSMILKINIQQTIDPYSLAKKLTTMQYKRNDHNFTRGTFRVKGDTLDVYPAHLSEEAWQISFFGDEIETIYAFDPLTGERIKNLSKIIIYPNSHYVIPKPTLEKSINSIKKELKLRLQELENTGKLLEKQRLEERTNFDLEMLITTGFCSGIENYSRHLTGLPAGSPPPTLFNYLPKNALLFVDESHVTIPQISAMYKGDRSRKITLSEHGFRLPSCLDNRPLTFDEWFQIKPQTIYVSATPASWELNLTNYQVIEQVVRPTGLLDPVCIVRPASTQVDDLLKACHETTKNNERILVTVLTKKMAENLTNYMLESGLKVQYLHSEINTLERMEILRQLRLGEFHILVGINLLREGLDIPECALVAILDADKEGFLRSKTSLIQTIGRAARNINGRVILYADHMTNALKEALEETNRRRQKQNQYNKKHGIVPTTIYKKIESLSLSKENSHIPPAQEIPQLISTLRHHMQQAAENLSFEEAAVLRDQIKKLEYLMIEQTTNQI